MKRSIQITITRKDGTIQTFADVAEWNEIRNFVFIRTRAKFFLNDKNRVQCEHYWIPSDVIDSMEVNDTNFFENKAEKTAFCRSERIKVE